MNSLHRRGGTEGAVAMARAVGMKIVLEELEERELERWMLRERTLSARATESELWRVVQEAASLDFPDVVQLAQERRLAVAEDHQRMAPEHERLLKEVAAAAASGDGDAIRAASTAAKAAGVAKKSIARMHALHSSCV
eukprot:NODE_28002_length_492_cov_4.964384.p2 GENE.NODE_28002_length_492_cov_4.964384~~NODE_28002_length_492_cov_4.964384.p2  ORF type:complete len:138 (+),score=50.22 NODE_28002_length_492_cov_4.964384:3-416(+)